MARQRPTNTPSSDRDTDASIARINLADGSWFLSDAGGLFTNGIADVSDTATETTLLCADIQATAFFYKPLVAIGGVSAVETAPLYIDAAIEATNDWDRATHARFEVLVGVTNTISTSATKYCVGGLRCTPTIWAARTKTSAPGDDITTGAARTSPIAYVQHRLVSTATSRNLYSNTSILDATVPKEQGATQNMGSPVDLTYLVVWIIKVTSSAASTVKLKMGVRIPQQPTAWAVG